MLTLMKGDKPVEVAEEGADAGLFARSWNFNFNLTKCRIF